MTTSQLGLTLNKSKTLTNVHPGPKFLLMTRVNEEENGNLTLNDVSPFLIKKTIDTICGSEVDLCKKLKNGSILIKTKNYTQAKYLVQLTSLLPTIKVDVSEHNYLNYSKGIIYCNDLRDINEEEILIELKAQGVVKVEKILKKVDTKLIETGLIIITFASLTLPETLLVGYEKVNVRVYIPRPMRCNNCYKYGHTTKHCNNSKICPNCALPHHTNKDIEEKCCITPTCVNCEHHGYTPSIHPVFDKICPVFLREKEIQAIITLEKTNRNNAVNIYNKRHPTNNTSYANTTKKSIDTAHKNEINPMPSTSTDTSLKEHTTRRIVDYDCLTEHLNPSSSKPPVAKLVKILPKNISNRTRHQLKRAAKPQGDNKSITGDSSDNGMMDTDATEI